MKSITGKAKTNTRDTILHTLKVSHQATIEELAEAAEISPVTVRHHLNSLQADNLIEVESVRRKVGRPYYVYTLSEKGLELFPKKYLRLTDRLLGELKENLPPETVQNLFTGIVQNIVEEHKGNYEHLPFEDRLIYLIKLLSEEGFLAQWEKVNNGYKITEFSCPYVSLVDKHSEICILDRELIVNVLQTPIQEHGCILNGDNCCEFTFSTSNINS